MPIGRPESMFTYDEDLPVKVEGEESQETYAQFALKRLGLRMDAMRDKLTLDIGAGGAEIAQEAKIQGVRVISIDNDPEKFDIHVEKGRARGLEYFKADAGRLPFRDETFDIIISHAGAATVTDSREKLSAIIDEAKRVLRPGGELRIWPQLNPRIFPEIDKKQTFDEQKERSRVLSLDFLKSIDENFKQEDTEDDEYPGNCKSVFKLKKSLKGK